MSWVLDLITVALFAFMIFRAWKDGFFKTLMNLISWVVALILAIVLAEPVATWIFDTFIRTGLTTTITEELAQSELTAFLQSWEDKLAAFPETVKNFLGMESGSMLGGLDLSLSAEEIASQLVNDVIAPLAILLISLVSITVLFLILTFALSVVVNILSKAFKLPLLRQADRSLGLVLGALQGLVAAAVFAFIMQALCNANLIDGVFTAEIFESTYVVSTVVNVLSILSVQGVPLSELADFVAIKDVL